MEEPEKLRRRIIAISGVNFRRLQRFAQPLEDTVNDAVTRILDLAEKKRDELEEAKATAEERGEGKTASTED